MGLSKEELAQLDSWLNANSVGNMPLERPTVAPVAFLDSPGSGHSSPLGDAPRLSESTRRRYAEKAARQRRKEEGYKKRKLPVGRFHHQKKARTKNKAAAKRWKVQPLKSLAFGYGNWAVTQEEWDRYLGPFWDLHDSDRLYVKRKWGHGTKASPYRIWHLKLYYQHTGKPKLLWDGSYLEDLYLTAPNELDVQLAHEGAELFL